MNTPTTQTNTAEKTPATPKTAIRLQPAVDLFEHEGGFVMSVEMPGVDHSTVTVSLERNELKITGTADFSGPDSARCLAGLAGPRIYEREFRLSEDIDRDRIEAEVKQGVLTLQLPKSNRAQKVSLPVKGA
ncbi:Hsp20/alpha crystallin family protein [Planctomicrobium sp. SH661]|uniref:Hsp20/alpha crystallin family protein n=1 Tax=Planctomicrobium sp. SH661 TaxID=3448124 RepID=UPI003F5AE06C